VDTGLNNLMVQKTLRSNVQNAWKIKMCKHTWYMREAGITCTLCGAIWDKETDSASQDA
jgi:hypothetical protein